MLRPVVRRLFPSCMSSEDDRPTYEGCTGIRLSNITDAKSRQGGQASSARNVSRTWPNKPIWANDIEHGSGPSLGPAQVTPDEDVDDYDDDESDLWQARERDTGRIDTGRDNGLRAG